MRVVAVLVAAVTVSAPALAQEMEPRAYSASPTGAIFLGAVLSRSTGSILFDPTLPISDVEAAVNGAALAGGATFGLFGKLAPLDAKAMLEVHVDLIFGPRRPA